MAEKIKLTKTELKKQRDALKRYRRYLPTLQLKKQLLQVEVRRVEQLREEKRRLQAEWKESIGPWIAVFGEEIDLAPYLEIAEVKTSQANIAGVAIPVFETLVFKQIPWDLLNLPPWVDPGIDFLKKILSIDVEVAILETQARLLREELRTTTQRVNLLEKIKIPETRDTIKRINIFLGDQQTAAVVRGKIAKSNLMARGSA